MFLSNTELTYTFFNYFIGNLLDQMRSNLPKSNYCWGNAQLDLLKGSEKPCTQRQADIETLRNAVNDQHRHVEVVSPPKLAPCQQGTP